jgi:hypothetical protein
MFGYIAANLKALSKEEKERYAKFYCGLCHELDAKYGHIGRMTLSYDMTFLSMLLSALYELEENCCSGRCIRHSIRRHPYVVTEATVYAAQMNLLLAYYQRMDDLADDHNPIAGIMGRKLVQYLPNIEESNPRQYAAITDCLRRLGDMERTGEINPDMPTNCFGEMVGALFVWRNDEYTGILRRMGAALGRFIYLLDAANDLRADVKKERYNPLVAQPAQDFTPLLTLMIAECTAEFEKLPIHRDKHILQNHLYSGAWQKYRIQNRKGADA